jgi:putative copper export protein/methionine-rich copper-binding protein CopC
MRATDARRTRHAGWRRRLPFVAMLATLMLLALARDAWAHAHLRKSDPAAGATIAAPATIRLWFTEEPELTLTGVRLTDSAGTVVTLGAATHDVDGALSVRLAISTTLHSGRWTVSWRTAALDGHPSNGTFTFRVTERLEIGRVTRPGSSAFPPPRLPELPRQMQVPPLPPESPPGSVAPDAVTPDVAADALTPMYVAARALSFVALLGLIGAATFRYAVLPRAAADGRIDVTTLLRRLASGAVLAAVCYVIAAAVRLSLQNSMMTGDAMLDAAHMRSMAMETHWGAVWRLQFGAGAAALIGAVMARRGARLGWLVLALAGVALAAGSALSGHAAASESLRSLAVIDDTLHVVGASGWLGSLFWLTLVAVPLQPASGDRVTTVAALVRAFSPAALGFAALVGATGLVSAWLRLGSLPLLWTSTYGQVLLVKLALLAGVAGTGFYNWRFVQPALGTDAASTRLQRSARVELMVGLLVIVVTAVLVAMPTPLR